MIQQEIWRLDAMLQPQHNHDVQVSRRQTLVEPLDSTESIINLAWDAWFASKPKQAGRELHRLLPKLQQILRIPAPPIQKLRVQELIIRCHGLLGAIYLDSLENDTALFHYTYAQQLATEIHDTHQSVTYLALVGDVLRRQNEKQQAIRYMENARDQSNNAEKATQGLILQLLAYAYADTGNETAFERTIREATDLLAFTGETRDTAKKEFTPFEIYEIRGKASRDLGKPLHAFRLSVGSGTISIASSSSSSFSSSRASSRTRCFDSGFPSVPIKSMMTAIA
jgi:tetratricopeptide (TPR) repeat protein